MYAKGFRTGTRTGTGHLSYIEIFQCLKFKTKNYKFLTILF